MRKANHIEELCPLLNHNRVVYVGHWDDLELGSLYLVEEPIEAHVYYQIPTRTFIVLDVTNRVARVNYMNRQLTSPNSKLSNADKDTVREYMGYEGGPITLRDVFMSGIYASDLVVEIPFGNKAKD